MSAHENYSDDESPDAETPIANSAADDFFVKMNRQFRRPKPSEEAVAAALQAIQSLAGEVVSGESEESLTAEGAQCPKCGGINAGSNRFCGYCGALVDRTQPSAAKPAASPVPGSPPKAPGQHVYHHHYHHHYFPAAGSRPENSQLAVRESNSPQISYSDAAGAEAALRQLLVDWTLHAKARAFDPLSALYSLDAILVRSDATLLRGRSSIRHYLEASGPSEVQLELTDTRLMAGVACLAGGVTRVAASARGREEGGGKFLMVARQESGSWRIVADIWCMNQDAFSRASDSLPQISDSEPAPASAQPGRPRFSR